MTSIAIGILGRLAQPPDQRVEIPRQVRNVLPVGRAEEAGINEPIAMCFDRSSRRTKRRRRRRDRCIERGQAAPDVGQDPLHAIANRRQPRSRTLLLHVELRRGARQWIVADERTIGDRVDHVVAELIGGDPRTQLQRDRIESARPFLELLQLLVQRQPKQPHDTLAMRTRRGVSRVEHLDAYTRSFIDDRRMTGQPLAIAQKADRLRQVAHIPRLHSGALDARIVGRECQLCRFAELRAQHAQVAAGSELATGGIDNPNVDDEMRRRL